MSIGDTREHGPGPNIARSAVEGRLEALRRKYAPVPGVIRHVDAIQAQLTEWVDSSGVADARSGSAAIPPIWTRFQASVFITRDLATGAPVVYEPNPTFPNLVGRIDHRPSAAGMDPDFMSLRAGSIHRANGGYLVMYARDLLADRSAYRAVERAPPSDRNPDDDLDRIDRRKLTWVDDTDLGHIERAGDAGDDG